MGKIGERSVRHRAQEDRGEEEKGKRSMGLTGEKSRVSQERSELGGRADKRDKDVCSVCGG